MDVQVHSLQIVFQGPVQFTVPMFQRPYVWDQEQQWEPLWDDVAAVAERLLEEEGDEQNLIPHFMGALVVVQQPTPTGEVGTRHVIDGQQRLTTLQLLIDGVEEVIRDHGNEYDSKLLRRLILNDEELFSGDKVFKIWPTNVDRDAFRAVMSDDVVAPPDLAERSIARAHAFFKQRAVDWSDTHGDPDKCAARLRALAVVLMGHLHVVVIDLAPEDNAQAIFETLNARGTPLLVSDLVKNYLLQEAVAQNLDAEALYREHWERFDEQKWRTEVRLGRLYWPRLDVFLYHWMVMCCASDVPTQQMFSRFKELAETGDAGPDGVMQELATFGGIYDTLDEAVEEDTEEGHFFYRWRTMQANVLTPLLMLIYERQERLGASQVEAMRQAIESWLVRRMVCRSSAKGYNHFLYSLLGDLKNTPDELFSAVLTDRLLDQEAVATEWPSDAQVTAAVVSNPLYRQITRGRLRLILEAIEDHSRDPHGKGKAEGPCPKGLTIEHVLPQQWSPQAWPLPSRDDEAHERRANLLHTLGNLTLVTYKLNPALSNSAWVVEQAGDDSEPADQESKPPKGKRAGLKAHSVLHINKDLVDLEDWNEDTILSRSRDLAETICEIWPRPDIVGETGAETLVY
jgi:hypothetical protein